MLKNSVRLFAALALVTTASSCRKDTVEPQGYWDIQFVKSLTATGYNPQNLCKVGGKSTMDISGQVYHNFKYQGTNSFMFTQPGLDAQLKFGNTQLNVNTSSTSRYTHHLSCSDLSVRIYNRAWAGGIFGLDNSYGHLEQDPSGACIVVADKNWDYRIVGVSVEIKGEGNNRLADGSTDYYNNEGWFEYDCQSGGYANGRMQSTASASTPDVKPTAADLRKALAKTPALEIR